MLLGNEQMPLQDNEVYDEDFHSGNWPVEQMLELFKEGSRGPGLQNMLNMAHATCRRAPAEALHDAAAFRQWLYAGSVNPAICTG